jgi:hypothetical protein
MRRRAVEICGAGLLAFLFMGIQALAQEPEPEPEEEPAIGITSQEPATAESQAARSFSQGVSYNSRNKFGFTLGAHAGYISNIYLYSYAKQDSGMVVFDPSVFANFGRRKHRLHLDYMFGYRLYFKDQSYNAGDHLANITYTYRANRKVTFQLFDHFSSTMNDWIPGYAPILTTDTSPIPPVYQVLYDRQRYTLNSAGARVDYQPWKKTRFGVFGSWDWYDYPDSYLSTVNGILVGGEFDQGITKWLFFSSRYTTYLNDVPGQLRDYQIHRLEVGGFRFKLSRNVSLLASGGIEFANAYGYYSTTDPAVSTNKDWTTGATYRVELTRSTRSNVLFASYNHMFTSSVGYPRLFQSDMFLAGFGQRLSVRWMFQASASYIRSNDLYYSGALQGWQARAALEYMIRRDLIMVAQYLYQNQENNINDISGIPYINRYAATIGIRYLYPSARTR